VLTRSEKLAGRRFRASVAAWLEKLNRDDPPDMTVPPVVRHVRHDCPAKGGTSVSFELREVYIVSPEFWVLLGEGDVPEQAMTPGEMLERVKLRPGLDDYDHIPPGVVAFIYREGKCSACGMTGRSGTGRVADALERPVIGGKALQWQMTGTGDGSPASGRTASPSSQTG
jgi:hypothetical protein